jgi:Concanavalin A-like lectin/glucanases superfamily
LFSRLASVHSPMAEDREPLQLRREPNQPEFPVASVLGVSASPVDIKGEKKVGSMAASPVALSPSPQPPIPDSYSHFDGDAFYTLGDLSQPDDADVITVLAWIYLHPTSSGNTQTIVATKGRPCDGKPANFGFSFTVNSFLTDDGMLRVDWSTPSGDCASLTSSRFAVSKGEWVHVGMSLIGGVSHEGVARLYMKGQTINSAVISGGNRQIQSSVKGSMRIGMHTDDEWGFHGRIAHVVVFHDALTSQQVYHVMKVGGKCVWAR